MIELGWAGSGLEVLVGVVFGVGRGKRGGRGMYMLKGGGKLSFGGIEIPCILDI